MKIILSPDQKRRGGDLTAIATLEYFIERHMKNETREFTLRIAPLWIKYLRSIAEEAVGSNYARRKMKSQFNFPFEDDYAKKYDKKRSK